MNSTFTCWPSHNSNVTVFFPKHCIARPFAAKAGNNSNMGSIATSVMQLFGHACVKLPLSSSRNVAPPHE
eukprot:12670074-Heterocapsa_arctica.AAC.1